MTRVDPEIVIPTPVAAQRETPSLENLTLDPECSIVHDAPKMVKIILYYISCHMMLCNLGGFRME